VKESRAEESGRRSEEWRVFTTANVLDRIGSDG